MTKSLRHLALLVSLILSGAIVALAAVLPISLLAAGGANAGLKWWDAQPSGLGSVDLPGVTQLKDDQGRTFAIFYSQYRVSVPLGQISPWVQKALIATEDSNFYHEGGIDPRGIARAMLSDLAGNGGLQGASTITQQYVKNVRLLDDEESGKNLASAAGDTFKRKVSEIKIASTLAKHLSKKQILDGYLNIVYFGNGAYGIEAASQRYYGIHASQLTIGQAATLIGLLKGPTIYNPIDHPVNARDRSFTVLSRMVETGAISRRQFNHYSRTKIKLQPRSLPPQGCQYSSAPFYCQYVENFLKTSDAFGSSQKVRNANWTHGGFTVQTALDPKAEKAGTTAVDKGLGVTNIYASAFSVVKPGTGYVTAVGENRIYGVPTSPKDVSHSEVVYANTLQQQGSSFKPITIAAALNAGYSPSLELPTPDPATFVGCANPPGGFHNDDGSAGTIPMRTALGASVNTYFVGLEAKVGVPAVDAMAHLLGATSIPPHLTNECDLTLGTYGVTPIMVAEVYSTFASGGINCSPTPVVNIIYPASGRKVTVNAGCHQALSSGEAFEIDDLLTAPLGPGGTAYGVHLFDNRVWGGKTGTNSGNTSVFFAGITPQDVATDWVGDPKGDYADPLGDLTAFGQAYYGVGDNHIPATVVADTLDGALQGTRPKWYPANPDYSNVLSLPTVPNVVGVGLPNGLALLRMAGYKIALNRSSTKPLPSTQTSNVIASQSPPAGATFSRNSTVTITLSNGSNLSQKIVP